MTTTRNTPPSSVEISFPKFLYCVFVTSDGARVLAKPYFLSFYIFGRDEVLHVFVLAKPHFLSFYIVKVAQELVKSFWRDLIS